jgi:hypothetical protein
MNAGRPRPVQTPANEDALIATVNDSRQGSHTIIYENLDCPYKYSITVSCIHTITPGVHICFQAFVLYGCSFANGYVINTLPMSSFCIMFCGQKKHVLSAKAFEVPTAITSWNGIILMLSANFIIKAVAASVFRLECLE